MRFRSAVLALGLAVLSACGSGSTDPAATSAESPESSDPTAATTSTLESATISFGDDVIPVISDNCASCHTGDGPGTTHLDMATAESFDGIAEFIGFKVSEGEMPPWPATNGSEIDFLWDLSLSDDERDTILGWVSEGGLIDVDPSTPIPATEPSFPPVEADLVVAADEPYAGEPGLIDDYRCRILELGTTETEWIRALDVRPDVREVLHHGVFFLADADTIEDARAQAAEDGRPGWQCQTVPRIGRSSAFQITAWAPGTGPMVLPEGAGIRVEPGDYLIAQWHYHYDGEIPADNSAVAVEFWDAAAVETSGGQLDQVWNQVLLGPVEIPCAEWEEGPLCSRTAAVARIQEEFGFESTLIPQFVNAGCGVEPDDFAAFTQGTASSTCDITVDGGEVVSLWPHMHELGTTYRMTLNPDTPDERILLEIDRWDFDWQMGYYPTEPLILADGDVVRVECGWDRSLWPAGLEPRYVVWAEGTQDEMCYSIITTRAS